MSRGFWDLSAPIPTVKFVISYFTAVTSAINHNERIHPLSVRSSSSNTCARSRIILLQVFNSDEVGQEDNHYNQIVNI